jgi:carbon monoxide dehydrogenase subunit G
MILETELSVTGPPQAVFDALVDAHRAAEAVPGARLLPTPADPLGGIGDAPGVGAELRLQAGRSQITYRGRVLPEEVDRAAGTITCSLDAREARGAGVLRGRLDLRLRPSTSGTRMRVDADLEVTGRAEGIGEERVRDAALRLLQRVADRLGQSTTAPEPAAEPSPGSLPVVTLGALDCRPPVPGQVRLVTPEPLPISMLPVSGGRLDDIWVELRRRPWAPVLVALALLVVVLGLRRARADSTK